MKAGSCHVPAGVAQERSTERVARPAVQPMQSLLGAQGVQRFGRPPPAIALVVQRMGGPAQQLREGVVEGIRRAHCRRRRGSRSPLSQRPLVRLLEHQWVHELVAVAGDGADEGRLLAVVAQRPAQGAHGLAEGAIRDHHVTPHLLQHVAAVDGLMTPFHQHDQQIEIAGDQRDFPTRPQQMALGG